MIRLRLFYKVIRKVRKCNNFFFAEKKFFYFFRIENKDTIQKSTIKEKELNLEYEKKSLPPTDKKLFIKKFNQIKPETIRKKNLVKNFQSNEMIEKYVKKLLIIFFIFFLFFSDNFKIFLKSFWKTIL